VTGDEENVSGYFYPKLDPAHAADYPTAPAVVATKLTLIAIVRILKGRAEASAGNLPCAALRNRVPARAECVNPDLWQTAFGAPHHPDRGVNLLPEPPLSILPKPAPWLLRDCSIQ